ncbi:MAG: hypothetical protein AB1476_06305 [Candidatus Hadarchaeota archaeon]
MGGEDEMDVLGNQLRFEISMSVLYETLPRMAKLLDGKTEIKKRGVTVSPDRAKVVLEWLAKDEKIHAKIVKKVLEAYEKSHEEMISKF